MTSRTERYKIGNCPIASIPIDVMQKDYLWNAVESAIGAFARIGFPSIRLIAAGFPLLGLPFNTAPARAIDVGANIGSKFLAAIGALFQSRGKSSLLVIPPRETGTRTKSRGPIAAALFRKEKSATPLATFGQQWRRFTKELRQPKMMSVNISSTGIYWPFTTSTEA